MKENEKPQIAKEVLMTDEETIEVCTKTIQQDPNNAKAYYDRAVAYNDYALSLPDYDEAIRLNPNYAEAYYDRGLLQYFKKNYTEALADFESALRIDRDSMSAEVDYAIEDMGGWKSLTWTDMGTWPKGDN